MKSTIFGLAAICVLTGLLAHFGLPSAEARARMDADKQNEISAELEWGNFQVCVKNARILLLLPRLTADDEPGWMSLDGSLVREPNKRSPIYRNIIKSVKKTNGTLNFRYDGSQGRITAADARGRNYIADYNYETRAIVLAPDNS